MANHEKDVSIEERLLKIQEEQLAFQKEQLKIQGQQAQAQLIVSEETAKRLKPKSLEIADCAQRSPFNPRGERSYPMPRLKCEIYAPWKMDPQSHSLTREEVELFNLLEPGEYHFDLNDGTPAIMRVVGVRNDATGQLEKLQLSPVPNWDNEHKGRFRSMAEILRQMLGGCTGIRTMAQEKAAIASGELAVSVNG